MNIYLAIFIGGGLGGITRFGVSKLITGNFSHINPFGTLISNILATAILGTVLFLGSTKFSLSPALKGLLITGFCGGFSTFSTFSYETFELLRSGHYIFAGINITISLLLGIFVLFVISRTV